MQRACGKEDASRSCSGIMVWLSLARAIAGPRSLRTSSSYKECTDWVFPQSNRPWWCLQWIVGLAHFAVGARLLHQLSRWVSDQTDTMLAAPSRSRTVAHVDSLYIYHITRLDYDDRHSRALACRLETAVYYRSFYRLPKDHTRVTHRLICADARTCNLCDPKSLGFGSL